MSNKLKQWYKRNLIPVPEKENKMKQWYRRNLNPVPKKNRLKQ